MGDSQHLIKDPTQEESSVLGGVSWTPVKKEPVADAAVTTLPQGGRKAPTKAAAQYAVADIDVLLHPKRRIGYGHKKHGLQPFVAQRLQDISMFLRVYIRGTEEWTKSSLTTARIFGRADYYAKRLRH